MLNAGSASKGWRAHTRIFMPKFSPIPAEPRGVHLPLAAHAGQSIWHPMSDAPRQPPPKKEVALALLEGSSLFVHLDPRRPGVLVPKGFTGQHQLVLQVGLNMAIPIPDLKVDDV